MKNRFKPLEKLIGYRFRHKELLETALTHRSFRFENGSIHVDNERLEFLGDAVLGSVAAAWLFKEYPDEQEGRLSMLKSAITNTKTLARIGERLELGNYLQLGRGEMLTGGHERGSNLANAVEAVMGAVYLDGGIKALRKVFAALFLSELDLVLHQKYINPKGMLQQYAQKFERCSPAYWILKEDGPPHAKSFTVEVRMNGKLFGTGTGPNKKTAEICAAQDALTRLPPQDIQSV